MGKPLTLGCIRSPSFTNSAVPLPARARPSTRAEDAPDPIPKVKHLMKKIQTVIKYKQKFQ